MTQSEIYYEAACIMSTLPLNEVTGEATRRAGASADEQDDFADMMMDGCSLPLSIELASSEIGWTERDFRTFMLLMASEAVKC